MSSLIRDGCLMVLSLLLIAGKVRADCLDGHLEDFRINPLAFAQTQWICSESVGNIGDLTGEAECFGLCHVEDPKRPWVHCAGPEASFSVTTTPTGYTITAHASVHPAELNFWHHVAEVSVYVDPSVVGGDVFCTPTGAHKTTQEGVVTVTPITPNYDSDTGEPNGDPSYALNCAAYGMDSSGSVDCTLTVTCVPTVTSDERYWNNPGGGTYQDSNNWDSGEGAYCAPVHNGQRSDIAYFALPNGAFIPVSGSGATAAEWLVINSPIEFSGSAQVFSTASVGPASVTSGGGPPPSRESLRILQGGQLRLASGASLNSVHASVGATGAANSKLEVKGGSSWTNSESARIGKGSVEVLEGGTASTGALTIGSGNGPGVVQVRDDGSFFDMTGVMVVGDATAGTLEIDRGFFKATTASFVTPMIGKSAAGTVTIRGDDSTPDSYGDFDVDMSLIVGNGASGRLSVERGGWVTVGEDLVVGGYGANPSGEVIVDGQGGDGVLGVSGGTFVNATELQEVVVQNGGRVSTDSLFIGHRQIRPGSADVTLRGASGSGPTLTVGSVGGQGVGTTVGIEASGQLNIRSGANAVLNNGLFVGSDAQGIVVVSDPPAQPQPGSRLTVNGRTQVGIAAPGIVQLDTGAVMENHGEMLIGLGGGNPSGTVTVRDTAFLRVNGALSVGATGIGLLNVLTGSGVRCDTLVVGRDTPAATGIIALTFFTSLTVDGNAQVGVAAGRGEILLADPNAILTINGTMTIGNPAGGPGGGSVALVEARIDGRGNIVVNPNGALMGTGTVAVPHISAGGIISPGLSPGTLTMDGDLEILPGGALIMEYAGQNPGEFDVLHVTGQTTLGGRLEVHFRDGFSPLDPAAFIQSEDFVEADGIVAGDFDRRIYAFPDLFADFDDDGDKDLTDVAAFQNCFGLSGGELEPACGRADWENDGVIGGREIQELGARLTGP